MRRVFQGAIVPTTFISSFAMLCLLLRVVTAQVTDKGSGSPEKETPSPSPSATETAKIDPCLIGTWTVMSVKDNKPAPMSGGTGFKITFTPDGKETIDYSGMKMFTWSLGDGSFQYAGSATAAVEARDGFAKIDKMENVGVSGTMRVKSVGVNSSRRIPDLGIGIASVRGGINYTCNGDTLTYQTFHEDKSDFNLTVTMTRAKEAGATTMARPAQSSAGEKSAAPPSSPAVPTQQKPADVETQLPKAFKKLPLGYKIVESPNNSRYFYAQWDGDSRPGLPLAWNPERGVWMPPGFVRVPGDAEHVSHSLTKEEAYWDDKSKRWISTKTGKVLGYEQ